MVNCDAEMLHSLINSSITIFCLKNGKCRFSRPPRDWTDRLPGFKIVFAPTKIEEGKREKKETEFPRYTCTLSVIQ